MSLVDPDNRRPVDYARRRELLASLGEPSTQLACELVTHFVDGRIKLHVTRTLMRVQVQTQEQVQRAEQQVEQVSNVQYHHADYDEALAEAATISDKPKAMPFVKAIGKVGRNDACPCGSGKKYKHCHGKLP